MIAVKVLYVADMGCLIIYFSCWMDIFSKKQIYENTTFEIGCGRFTHKKTFLQHMYLLNDFKKSS